MKGWELLTNNALLIGGLVALGIGCWQKDPAWALIITGGLAVTAAIVKGLRNAEPRG